MQKNAGVKPLRWLGKTNLQSKNSTPTGRCQAETGKFAEVNFSVQETICILYTAKPLTFLPERSILLAWLVVLNHGRYYMIQDAFWGILIPFLGTSLGAGCVFFLKKSLSDGIQRALTGFAAGVMVAASVWSLLIPAMEQAADLGRLAFFPAAVGFWLGILFLLLLDHLIPHLHQNSLQAEGPKASSSAPP